MRLPRLSALVLVALVLTACSGGGGDDKTAETKHHEATTTSATVADLQLTRGEVAVASAGGDVTLDEKTQQAVVDAAKSYIDAAVISPVSDGKVGKDYDGLFDSAVSANATGPDR